MPVCCLPKCRNKSSEQLSLFKLQGDFHSRLKWKNFCAENGNVTSESLLLCENHFSSRDIVKLGGRHKLNLNATPIYSSLYDKQVI